MVKACARNPGIAKPVGGIQQGSARFMETVSQGYGLPPNQGATEPDRLRNGRLSCRWPNRSSQRANFPLIFAFLIRGEREFTKSLRKLAVLLAISSYSILAMPAHAQHEVDPARITSARHPRRRLRTKARR